MVETTQQETGDDTSMEQLDDQELIGILVDEQQLIAEAEGIVADIKRVLLTRIPKGELRTFAKSVDGMGEAPFAIEIRHKSKKSWHYSEGQIIRLLKENNQNPAAYIHKEEMLDMVTFEADLSHDPEFLTSFGRFVERKETDYIEIGGLNKLLKARGVR